MGRRSFSLEAVNERLKAAKIGLTVFQRGDKLSLRGTLPPKPGSTKAKAHQQLIRLDVYANPAGFEHAETKAHEIGSLLAQKRFSWFDIEGDRRHSDSCSVWVERFKQYALQNLISSNGEQAELDWKNRFWYVAFSKLDQKSDLTPDSIIKAVHKTKPNSRSRQVCCQRMSKLATFADLQIDLSPYRGSYNPREVKRDIPSDKDIEKAIDAMLNPEWQWIAGMMATYGLRDHEYWYASLVRMERDGRLVWMCEIADGKTGARKSIPPLPPDWADRWRLYDVRFPKLNVRNNKEYGDRTARAFDRQKNPHQPYGYRHAFAIRSAVIYKFPTAIIARWMGHSPTVFLNTYQRHISEAQATDAFFEKI